jgi:hypothetical protein
MTSPTRRDVERRLDDLDAPGSAAAGHDYLVVFEDADTGERRDGDGAPVPDDATARVVLREEVVETGWSA